MPIQPLILGRGSSGQALAKAAAIARAIEPDLDIADPRFLARDESLAEAVRSTANPLPMIANPHGLHAARIVEAARAGARFVIAEKPAAVNLGEVAELRALSNPVAVCHGYRMMWGPRRLRQMIAEGALGEIIAVEGRYWQASTAKRALGEAHRPGSWKNDPRLSGPHDALLDVAPHWVDAVFQLMGAKATRARSWTSRANAEAPHRDTHVQLHLEFPGGRRALGSISKTVHGSSNHFELNVLGTRKSAAWRFEDPDRLRIGEGSRCTTLSRDECGSGTGQAVFHGAGWLEGYVEIVHQVARAMRGIPPREFPTLASHLDVLETLLTLEAL